MVVMSIETCEQIGENYRIDDTIVESEAEYQAQGVLLDAAETLSGLKRKHLRKNTHPWDSGNKE